MPEEKLVVKVIKAMQDGADTSNEIADMIGVSVALVSATLSDMKKDGMARETGRWKCFRNGKHGRNKSRCVELTANTNLRSPVVI